jgi:DNA-binding transcriptional regulator WhiA
MIKIDYMKKINIDKNNIIFDYRQGKSLTCLKNKYNLDKRTLKKILLEANCYIDSYKKIISEIEINSIIDDYNNRITVEKICERYSIGRRRINKLLLEKGIINHGNHKFDFNRRIFENIDNEKKAYWLGFIYADGSVYKSKDNISHHLTIKLSSKDSNHLHKFKKDFNLPQEIKLRKENGFSGGFESARIRLVSKDLVNDLICHGCVPNKTFVLQFPKIDKTLFNHFIRGYFDGDGSISITNKQKQITILGNYDFLFKLQEILIENCGINKTKLSKREKIYYLHYGGNLSIKKIGEFLYDDSTTYMGRKYELFQE